MVQERKSGSPYADPHTFMLEVVPWENSTSGSELLQAFNELWSAGKWDEELTRRVESVYLSVRGRSMQEDKKDQTGRRKLRRDVMAAERITQRFVAVVANNIDHPQFDIDEFQEIYLDIYHNCGPEVTKWFAINYPSFAIGQPFDVDKYSKSIKEVTLRSGRRIGALFTIGYMRLQRAEILTDDFEQAIIRIKASVGLEAAKTFTLNTANAIQRGYTLEQFENFVIENTKQLGASANYWLTVSLMEIDNTSDLDIGHLISDALALKDKHGKKVAAIYARAISNVVKTQKALDKQIEFMQGYIPTPNMDISQADWNTALDRHIEWRRKIDVFYFRRNYAMLLERFGPYTANFYALTRLDPHRAPSFCDIEEDIVNYIQKVGEKFAKVSLWLIQRITAGYPYETRQAFQKITEVFESQGQEAAMDILRYSYGASKRGNIGIVFKDEDAENSELTEDVLDSLDLLE